MRKTVVYFKIAPKAPLFRTLTYKSLQWLKPGQRVKIPLGVRSVNGLVLEEDWPDQKLKTIKEVLDIDENSPPLSPQRIRWLQWMGSYYHYPMGLVADLSFLPSGHFKKRKDSLLPANPMVAQKKTAFVELTPEQKHCMEQIVQSKGFAVHLIHGVTGSGKTEIYKQLIARILNQNQQVLVLLPEIFLTPQIVQRFSESFPDQTALLHSQITARQKRLVWQSLLKAEKNLLVGTRSALFCPLPHLGLIIIDEEHDSSFKQEDKFRYHARDSAIVLAKELNIPIVLGSATPDFSSYNKALDGSYHLHELKNRAFKQSLPQVTVVDLKKPSSKDRPFWLSDLLFEKIQKTLNNGKQAALFLNRRGQSTALICPQCGHVQKCLNCDISLTLHKDNDLLCHYCSFLKKKPSHCPSCQGSDWLERGLGTQAVQKAMEKLFPDVQTIRVDRDNIQSQEEREQFIKTVEKEEAQIIIGTQMLSKGLNFPSVYLVGLILADMDFHLPDFRAEEKTFQTLLQMSGRAGRITFGEVVLQTFNPNHSSILFAQKHDYKGFFYEGMKSREKWFYPPFSRLCLFRVDSLKEKKGQSFAIDIVQKALKLAPPGIKILGPSPAPLTKIKNRYRFQILIKGKNHSLLNNFLNCLLSQIKKKTFVQVKVDRDPLSML